MLLQHEFVIHLVDMIPGRSTMTWLYPLYDIDVLINGVGRPEIPSCLGDAWLAGRMSKLSLRSAKEIPAHL